MGQILLPIALSDTFTMGYGGRQYNGILEMTVMTSGCELSPMI